jgi:hypothetical protein
MLLYGTTSGEPPRRALREQPTARGAVHAMLRATADEITRPDTPHGCVLILAAPTGAVENHAVREFLADLRHDMHTTIKDRLARGVTNGDLAASPASLDAIARYGADRPIRPRDLHPQGRGHVRNSRRFHLRRRRGVRQTVLGSTRRKPPRSRPPDVHGRPAPHHRMRGTLHEFLSSASLAHPCPERPPLTFPDAARASKERNTMIRHLPDLVLEITAHDPGTIETELNAAVETVLTQAMRARSCGVLVTQHGYNRYTVALSPDVPYGQTHEHREWDRPASASIHAETSKPEGPAEQSEQRAA